MNASEPERPAERQAVAADETAWKKGRLRAGAWIGLTAFAWILLLGNALGVSAAPPDAQAAPGSFAELMRRFDQMEGFEARFEETKTLALLIAPLRSSGRLYYASKPSALLRRVEAPRPTDILVTKSVVRIRDGMSEQVVDLASHSEARPFVESMLWLFAGDAAALEAEFGIDYQVRSRDVDLQAQDESAAARDGGGVARGRGQGAAWDLRLVPRQAPTNRLVEQIRIRGVGAAAESIELLEPNGDRTLTRILDPKTDRQFDAEERRALFGPPES